MDFIKCPVCNGLLIKNDKSYVCSNSHCYDISKKGYTNMLLANQHHSLSPGDSKEMIDARVRFLSTNHYQILRNTIVETIKKHCDLGVLNFGDIACGEGYYTNYIHDELSQKRIVKTAGIDISKYGVIEAFKKIKTTQHENIEYFIGNLSNLPFMDDTFNVLLNCFAPMDEKEFIRVLKHDGIYIRVLPDWDHLWGIKEVLYENIKPNIMKDKNLHGFTLIDEINVRDEIVLSNNQQIKDLFMMTPYYYKSPIDKSRELQEKNSLKTIISFVILVYKKSV